jgi:hypothetical protein
MSRVSYSAAPPVDCDGGSMRWNIPALSSL